MKENKQAFITKKERTGKVWPVILCMLLAGGVFLLLLNVESRKLATYEKGEVVVAITNVTDTKEITKENLAEFFAVEERPISDIPEAAYLTPDELIGQYARNNIDAGSVITESMFGELQPNYSNVVLLGVNMESLAQSVAGTLRAGDVIDIYTVMEDDTENVVVEKVLSKVTIDRSYTSSGVAILKEDTDSIAHYVTIPVHSDAVGIFYQALEERRIEVVKHP